MIQSGITLEKDKATINLDFTKIFRRDRMKEEDTLPTSLFLDLSQTPFRDLIEHPLCQTFLQNKFNKVVWYFVFFIMVPHFLFSLIYSFYSGFIFGHLCAINASDNDRRWEWNQDIPCRDMSDTEVSPGKLLIIFKLNIQCYRKLLPLLVGSCSFSAC